MRIKKNWPKKENKRKNWQIFESNPEGLQGYSYTHETIKHIGNLRVMRWNEVTDKQMKSTQWLGIQDKIQQNVSKSQRRSKIRGYIKQEIKI